MIFYFEHSHLDAWTSEESTLGWISSSTISKEIETFDIVAHNKFPQNMRKLECPQA